MSNLTLVTGAAGFIGSHLSKRLESEGRDLILVDDFSRGKQSYLDYLKVKTPVTTLDLRDRNKTLQIFKNVNTVFHCACRIGGVQFLHGSAEKEFLAFNDNLLLDASVFNACYHSKKLENIVYTSSVSVYNTREQKKEDPHIFNEQDFSNLPIDPEGGYGYSKVMGTFQLMLLRDFKEIQTGTARIFKSYGPCDDYSEKSGQVVCSLMRKAINYPKEPFVIWGDGTTERCLLYIDDLIDALLLIEKKGGVFNIGHSQSVSIKTLAEKIIKLSGKPINPTYQTLIYDEPKNRIPDLKRAKIKLNWSPTTPLDLGLQKTYSWMSQESME